MNLENFASFKKFNIIGKEITITITTLNSQTISVTILSSANLNELIKKIEELTGESMKNKILMSGSTKLIENKRLEQYNIKDGANLKIIENANKGNIFNLYHNHRLSDFYKHF